MSRWYFHQIKPIPLELLPKNIFHISWFTVDFSVKLIFSKNESLPHAVSLKWIFFQPGSFPQVFSTETGSTFILFDHILANVIRKVIQIRPFDLWISNHKAVCYTRQSLKLKYIKQNPILKALLSENVLHFCEVWIFWTTSLVQIKTAKWPLWENTI